jgi:hypothetical protein
MSSRNYTIYIFVVTALVLLTFGILHYLQVPAGTLIDWVVCIVAFWWFIGITTVPWNMYFTAREVLLEAKTSTEKGIDISGVNLAYARRVASRFVWVAIALHLFSAILLFLLAYYQISIVGYLASGIALLLTFVRPLHRLYEHISLRLGQLSQQIKYPREDVAELSQRVYELEGRLKSLQELTDIESKDSWTYQMEGKTSEMQEQLESISGSLEEFEVQNKREHEQLGKNTEEEIKRFSEDAQFLNQVREIIRFFKKV